MAIRILLLLLIVYCLVGVFLYVYQRNVLYLPVGAGSHGYPVEYVSSGDQTLEVIVLNTGQQDAVLYFGGNAEAVVGNAAGFQHVLPRHTVYLVNYRGYGGSTGTPTEEGLYQDAKAVFDAVQKQHRRVSAIGRSLGSGVATFLATERPVHKLLLITPFDSILHLVQDQYPIYPVSLMLKDQYDSIARVGKIAAETLIVIAEHDLIVPAKYSRLLAGAFPPDQVTVTTLEGAGHNGMAAHAGYYPLIGGFLNGAID